MNLFDLFIKIGVDDQASDHISKLSGSFKTGLANAAKVGTAAVGAAATAVAALTKSSYEQYADYEQLAGGAQLMFGDAYSYIEEKAESAYSTVQLSQNEYLKQVNQFATGLKTALNGDADAAAVLADRIITAEADIIAATGNASENVQNAFAGIMRSNYTMLDNLQIGITPTKEGFQELIDKVNEWNAENGKATNYTISNTADAQNALIDYIEMMGYSGYASAEAAGTIQGSTASMKAAWNNLLIAMSDDTADLDHTINNFVEVTTATFEDNIIPRISQGVDGVGKLITGIAPIIIEEIPGIIDTIVPTALEAVGVLVTSIYNTLADNGGKLFESGIDLLADLLDGLTTAITDGDAIGKLVSLVDSIADTMTNPEQLDKIIKTSQTLIQQLAVSLADNAPELVESAMEVIESLLEYFLDPENIVQTQATGLKITLALASGLLDAGTTLRENTKELVGNIIETIFTTDWLQVGADIVSEIAGGLKDAWDSVTNFVGGLFDGNSGGSSGGGRDRSDGSHASGLDYVPRNNYLANLHQGEAVLTAQEAEKWRSGRSEMQEVNIVINIQSGVVNDSGTARSLAQYISEELQALSQDNAALVGSW